MSLQENKAVVRRFSEEFKNRANLSIVDELMTPDFVHHFKDPRLAPGREGLKQLGQSIFAGFSDVHVTVEALIAEGDLVVERSTARARHSGEFSRVPPTGHAVVWTEIHVYRLMDGKIAELWSEFDLLGILMQIGALPVPA